MANYSLGIMNYCSHDPGCALIKEENGEIDLIFAEEGFLSRRKKSYHFPIRSMKYCLDFFGISIEDINVVMVDYMDHKRVYRTSNNYRLLIGDFIRSKLKIPSHKIKFAESHHYAHALTAFWPSGFDESAVMVVDGLGSKQQTHSIFHMRKDGECKKIFEQKGAGIGALYTSITKALNFESGEEGKTMGLAPYGRNIKDYSFDELKGQYEGLNTDYSHILDRSPSFFLKKDYRKPKSKDDLYSPYFVKLAYDLQTETERCLMHLAKKSIEKTGSKNLCFAGGVALNCVANNKIQHLDEVENFWVQPASGDTGIPIGLAIAGLKEIGLNLGTLFTADNRKKISIPYSQDPKPLENLYQKELNDIFSKHGIVLSEFNASYIAKRISSEKIISIFSKGIELGPRALGHRSFLADASSKDMKEIMNSKIKHREAYRPFAPMVLKKDFNKYFESITNNHPYMLQAPKCKEKAKKEVPSICHVDDTARVQTVDKNNGKVHEIINEYKNLTNKSVIINTSFNDNNEPIVFTKLDAICSFLRCNADTLILEEKVLDRENITDIEQLRSDVLKLQEHILTEYFKESLSSLTHITKSKKEYHDLNNFIKFNLSLTSYHKTERMYLKLIDFIFNRDSTRKLFTDQYHLKILHEIFEENAYKELFLGKVVLVEDRFSSRNLIEEDSDFILFNLSAYFLNVYSRKEFVKPNSINSFYEISDKKLVSNHYYKENDLIEVKTSAIEQILKSYEHNRDSDIEEFFNRFE